MELGQCPYADKLSFNHPVLSNKGTILYSTKGSITVLQSMNAHLRWLYKKKTLWSDSFREWWIYKIFMLCGLCLAWVEKKILQFKEWCRENSTYLSWSCLSIGTDLIHKSNAAKQIGYTCNNLLTVVCYCLLPIRHAMHTNNPFNEWGKYQCIH